MKIVDELLSKEWLEKKYIDEGLTYSQIGVLVGRSKHAVYRAIKKLGIKSRKHTSRFPQLNNKEWLKEQYLVKEMTLREIAELIGTTIGNIHSALTHAGIPTRNYKDGLKVKYREGRFGELASNWRGGSRKTGSGHIYVYKPDHPLANKAGYVMEHRLVVEKAIDRYLTSEEVIHHKNGIKDDNRLENLQLCANQKEHNLIHWEALPKLAIAEQEIIRLKQLLDENNISY